MYSLVRAASRIPQCLSRVVSRDFSVVSRDNTRDLLDDQIALRDEGVFDGERLVLHHESRYLCRCPKCWGATSNQPLHTKDFTTVRVSQINNIQEHFISLQWDDGHTGLLPRTQTGAYGNGVRTPPPQHYYDLSLRRNAAQIFWDRPLPELTKRFEYDEVVGDVTKLKEFLAHFMMYGLAFLSNTPHQTGDLKQIIANLDVLPYHETLFGVLSSVSYESDPVNQAFNNQYLELHTDMPYYTQTPAVYFFHCVANQLEGGESFWGDSFSALQYIRDNHRAMFTLLSEIMVPFRQYRSGWHLAGRYPTVELTDGDMYRVRDCGFVIDNYQFIRDYDPDTRAAWWEAYGTLRGLMNDPTRVVKVKLQSGDLVVIDNWRVQHGREEFKVPKEGGKRRIMDVVYVEWTHVQNRLLK